MKKLTKDDLKKFRDRLYLPISDRDLERGLRRDRRRAVLPPRRGLPRDRVHDGAPPATRRLAAQAGACAPSRSSSPATRSTAELKQGSGKNSDRHHDGRRPPAQGLDEGQGDRQAHRADRPRRVPHLRHGLDVPERQGLQPGRPAATSRSTASCCSPTRSPPRARCSTRASPRPARWPRRPLPGSAYSTHGEHMIPFYIFYSMFGFQRTGDSVWAMADQLARGLPDRRDRGPDHPDR